MPGKRAMLSLLSISYLADYLRAALADGITGCDPEFGGFTQLQGNGAKIKFLGFWDQLKRLGASQQRFKGGFWGRATG